jgi:hypothetical protein
MMQGSNHIIPEAQVYLPGTPWQEVVATDRDLAKKDSLLLVQGKAKIVSIPVEIPYITKIFAMVFYRLGWAVSI